MNILNLYTADINTYCIDLTNYIYENKKRFNGMEYVERKIPLHMIDKLKEIKFVELYKRYGEQLTGYETLNMTHNKYGNDNMSVFDFYKKIHLHHPYLTSKLQNLIILSYPKFSVHPWHFYYIFKPYEYLFEKKMIAFIPSARTDKIDELIKNLENEVKFIHENKFRQI